MKPQKRSIRDFFAPLSQSSQATLESTPLQRASSNASNAQASRSTNSSTSAITTAPAPTRATSTEAAPPQPSQNSVNSGASRRIVSNGEQIVLNSDSDSDSLPDLDWGDSKPSFKVSTTTTRSKRTADEVDGDLRRPPKKEKSKEQSFSLLLESAHKNIETEQRIKEHKAVLEEDLEDTPKANLAINEDILGQAVQDDDDDPEKAHRLFLAMQRTNATQLQSVYYFFEDTSDSTPVQHHKFPYDSLPKQRWASSFQDSTTLDQAFLTGFAHQVFRLQELPEEIASWMLDQICIGRNEVLNERFLEILESHHVHFQTLLDIKKLDAIFSSIGANVQKLNSGAKVAPSSEDQSATRPSLPASLKSTAKLLHRAAPWLHTKVRSHALYILCHVCLDNRVQGDVDVLNSVQDAIEATICNFADNQRLTSGVGSPPAEQHTQSLIVSQLSDTIPQLLSRITHPILQRNLICALPARSPLTTYLRRHLALSFLLDPTTVNVPLADPKIPDLVHKHLNTSPNFRINKDTDYGHLAARLTLLDIAIGPGFLSVPYQPLISPAPSRAGSSPVTSPFPISSEIKDFNKEVDALAQHIKLLGNTIVEAGAVVDLTILDAKDCVERLCSRLEHAARIGGKRVHNIFGNPDDERQLRVSKFFLNAKKPATPTPQRGGIFDEDDM
ncbi:uncharacterized protein K460DRAFT_401845 [Cucurbitaria berberidis CBS 394.84]|uniref:Uncharacterized protein n=1 Tax=Cucurbitaria berberidis CBS 394.84 TaxID=1168544 RepID=A0A9P4LEY2_9PLEO|nr:uncharacterized protein K460DRAFT_401845 [Cucurbitaria berberidis CBS 394.84]KAF1851842.1 hypothetical protein K460DRAFT_401845 [Cucurbitaria berberidis CBS 394.84]